jgi:diguanylate cyclase (GGDEF)-like protein
MSGAGDLQAILSAFCPMHLAVNATGHVTHAGATLHKLCGPGLVGRRFLELFEVLRPQSLLSVADLRAAAGRKLHLQFRAAPHTAFKGILAPMADGGAAVNLSFGIAVLDAVRDHALTSADFSPTDLTVEMMYLVEAKSAAMEASRSLNMKLQGARIAAEEQAFTDTLTGLKNRRALEHIAARLIGRGIGFALMQIDLDYFKAVNDTMGHAAGDHVLQTAARIMVDETREEDTVARIGGDEFVLIFAGQVKRPVLEQIGKRLIARLEEPIPFGAAQCRVSCSIGTVLAQDHAAPGLDALLRDADLALYASKSAGRARHTFYGPEIARASGLAH